MKLMRYLQKTLHKVSYIFLSDIVRHAFSSKSTHVESRRKWGTPGSATEIRCSFSILAVFWIPVVDGQFIPDDPRVLLESGRVNKKDVMIGVNKDEGTWFVGKLAGW